MFPAMSLGQCTDNLETQPMGGRVEDAVAAARAEAIDREQQQVREMEAQHQRRLDELAKLRQSERRRSETEDAKPFIADKPVTRLHWQIL